VYSDAVGVRRKQEKALGVETRQDSQALFPRLLKLLAVSYKKLGKQATTSQKPLVDKLVLLPIYRFAIEVKCQSENYPSDSDLHYFFCGLKSDCW
jgi:hypothetical protein